ncbi:MAG: PQQ-binding-like beta-propeller repeat protein [Planctomycetes bacterium]|nr:PQQ-binding-like beta-propeller repeat protein [Planctomycetota bacterium]
MRLRLSALRHLRLLRLLALLTVLPASLGVSSPARADWPMLRGGPERTAFVSEPVRPPFRLAWARRIKLERLGSAVEPVVAAGKVFVATHAGSAFALDAATGAPLWRFRARGPFLHSPAFAAGLVVAASADGRLYALDAATGEARWQVEAGRGGFASSPLAADGVVFAGSRSGELVAVELASGKALWRRHIGTPVRQSAALAEGAVIVTAEDLRVRALDAATGAVRWTSRQLEGQTARDYSPVVVRSGGRVLAAVRTSPAINFSQLIALDRRAICQSAGVDDSDWRKIEAWARSEAARGSPELWAREDEAILRHLRERPEARTFFLLDAKTGEEVAPAPVLWCGGCQGVGAQPAALPDGRMLVFRRSAYGNWTLGVAPLVALGLLDPLRGRVEPLQHAHGAQPPWNTFWGTADESQSFAVAGRLAIAVHQGTLSGFDLDSRRLERIAGDRDTYGGFRNPPWARNEWHGPARGGVAIDGGRLYWITGSRVLCLEPGEGGGPAKDEGIDPSRVPTREAPPLAPATRDEVRDLLAQAVEEAISRRWAPLVLEPGLAGREVLFAEAGDLFASLAWAFPHLGAPLKERVKAALAEEWSRRPPFLGSIQPPGEGERRELSRVRESALARSGGDPPGHPFGWMHAVLLYAERCGEWERVLDAWPRLAEAFERFEALGWSLDGEKGDRFANRHLAALLSFARIAERKGDGAAASRARALASRTAEELVKWWRRAAAEGAPGTFAGVGELDRFIGSGSAVFLRIRPHKAKVALFGDLAPEVAALLKERAPEEVAEVWRAFGVLCPTWHLMGEERQVHYGENFIDPPDLALGAFQAMAWLAGADSAELARRADVPLCRADLTWIAKLAVALEGR